MSRYAVTTHDIYDDAGAILLRVIPDADDLPDFVKTAAQIGRDGDVQQYALVMVEDGRVMKKFAMADRGNTWLSTLYFGVTHDSLPEEAQKVAAANLLAACDHYGIQAPDILTELTGGPVDSNIVDVGGQAPPVKVASADQEDVQYAIERADGSKYYPLRDAKDANLAMQYFEQNAGNFQPRERREFAVKTAAVAAKTALPLTEKIAAYSAEGWNPAVEGHITTRYMHLVEADAPPEVRKRLEKLAHVRHELGPAAFADQLAAFDQEAGLDALWDRYVEDPWYSTLGMQKIAKGSSGHPQSFTVGDQTVSAADLQGLADRGMKTIGEHFGQKFAKAFLANPVEQFKALPKPNQIFIARLAQSTVDAGEV
jgi:hypothetical protein